MPDDHIQFVPKALTVALVGSNLLFVVVCFRILSEPFQRSLDGHKRSVQYVFDEVSLINTLSKRAAVFYSVNGCDSTHNTAEKLICLFACVYDLIL